MARSIIAIYGAVTANVAIAVTKCGVAGITGSSAMLTAYVSSEQADHVNAVLHKLIHWGFAAENLG